MSKRAEGRESGKHSVAESSGEAGGGIEMKMQVIFVRRAGRVKFGF